MNDAGIRVKKKSRNLLYNLLVKSISEINITMFLNCQPHKDFLILIFEMCVN